MSKKKKLIPELRFPEFENEGEWEIKTIGDVANSESSSMALNKLDLKPTGYPVYGADSIVGYIDEFQHKEKYISIVKDGSGVGRLNLCQSNSSILGTLTSLKSKNKKQYDLDWLYYLLNTVDFSVYVKGAGIPHIYYSDFKNENVPVPTPKEQQKIASCLSSLDEVIEAHSKKLELLKDHKKGLMQNLFPQDGEKVPKLRFKEFENSGEWEEKKISDLGETISGLTGKSKDDFGAGKPFVTYKQVFDNSEINFEQCERVQISDDENQTSLQQGDILFTTSSETPNEVGFASVLIDFPKEKTYLNSFCFALRPFNIEKTQPQFSRYLFHSPIYRRSVTAIAQGSTRYNISKGAFVEIQVPIPAPTEQQKIASCLSSLDEVIEAQVAKIEQLKLHKKGLMQGLFPKIND